jgi:hypothetical protein
MHGAHAFPQVESHTECEHRTCKDELSQWSDFEDSDSSMSYLTLCLAGTAVFPSMTCLGTPVIAGTVWAIAFFNALRVLEFSSSIVDSDKASSTATATIVATAKKASTWLRTAEDWRGDILETANLNRMTTPRNSFLHPDIALDCF